MTKSHKIWGTTYEILKNPFVEVHRAIIEKGGVCSEHIHSFKNNFFILESGKIIIRQFRDGSDIVDETVLDTAGDSIECKPNEFHQFEALEDSVIYEVYYPVAITDNGGNDIIRRSEGFKK